MDAIREGMEFNGRVWKEPRGFIKILELIFGICAFATTSSFSSMVGITYSCWKGTAGSIKATNASYAFSYPFDLEDEKIPVNICNGSHDSYDIILGGSYKSSAEFFVAVGVLTFLYCLGALLVYIFLDKLYRSRDSVALTDFIATVAFAFFWLVSSSAWAHGVSGVKTSTDPSTLAARLNANDPAHPTEPACNGCLPYSSPNYANLNISVIFGFLNFFIWSGNVWFLYKETSWYKSTHPDEILPPPVAGSAGPGMAPSKL